MVLALMVLRVGAAPAHRCRFGLSMEADVGRYATGWRRGAAFRKKSANTRRAWVGTDVFGL